MNRTNASVVLFVILLLAIVGNTILVLDNISQVSSDESHTRKVQIQGGPVAVCLLDALKATEPLLLKIPSVDAPLSEYVHLQSHRYPGVKCND